MRGALSPGEVLARPQRDSHLATSPRAARSAIISARERRKQVEAHAPLGVGDRRDAIDPGGREIQDRRQDAGGRSEPAAAGGEESQPGERSETHQDGLSRQRPRYQSSFEHHRQQRQHFGAERKAGVDVVFEERNASRLKELLGTLEVILVDIEVGRGETRAQQRRQQKGGESREEEPVTGTQ